MEASWLRYPQGTLKVTVSVKPFAVISIPHRDSCTTDFFGVNKASLWILQCLHNEGIPHLLLHKVFRKVTNGLGIPFFLYAFVP
ncbi:MAG: hypothetical protein ACO2PL_19405 [Armatimonadota bacterium]